MNKLSGKKGSSSDYYGVTKITSYKGCKYKIDYNRKNPWIATISINKKIRVFLGQHPTEREAAIAVDKKLISLGILDKLNILKPKTI